jgi:CheY-like chemotaxis protein
MVEMLRNLRAGRWRNAGAVGRGAGFTGCLKNPMNYSPDHIEAAGRILVVEDNPLVRELMQHLLADIGCEILTAADGAEGLMVFESAGHRVDLLITDYHLPRMNGPELAHECARRNRSLRILYVSGRAPDDKLQAEIARGRAFLSKPFHGQVLVEKARELLADSAS